MSAVRFHLDARDAGTAARTGRLETPHGTFPTPMFMPVGTAATVKGVTPAQLEAVGAGVILANTFHLFLRPGHERVRALGGLHRFSGWHRGILTDSGGFQVYSLSRLRRIREEGVEFRSPIDGALCFLTPERAVEVQEALGADIAMAFDECPPAGAERAYVEQSLARTLRWAARCLKARRRTEDQALFGIVQGGVHEDLRLRSAAETVALGFDGYAIGGLSVGESKEDCWRVVAAVAPALPEGRVRYLMGMGTPADLVAAVGLGVDLFDCVLPTRCARNGLLFTSAGRIKLTQARFRDDPAPPDAGCACYTCREGFSRAYLRHLHRAREILGAVLATIHNLHYYLSLMGEIRAAIGAGTYLTFQRGFSTVPEDLP